MRTGEGDLGRLGRNFPVTRFRWRAKHTYRGCEIGHLWFSRIIGEEAYGNLVATWRGPMDVEFDYVRDQTERILWEEGSRIRGPDLFHVVSEFPQIGNDIRLMYAFQAMLSDGLAIRLLELGEEPTVKGTDIYVDGGKLNVGVCSSNSTSCTMHFGVNMGLDGEPRVPENVVARGLADLLGGRDDRAVELMEGVIAAWIDRIDGIHLKAYKSR